MSEDRQPAGDPSRRAGLLVCLVAVVLYGGTLAYDFVWDDAHLIVQNPYIASWRFLPDLFTGDVTRLTSGALHSVYYRPLFWLSLLADHTVWGLRPAGYHLTNVLLYGGVCWLLFRLLYSLLRRPTVALLATLLFAAHPSHVHTVAWISGRCDPMPALFLLLALLGYGAARHRVGRPRWGYGLGALVAFGCALLSKESAACLPLLLGWFEACFPMSGPAGLRSGWRGAARRLWPFALTLLAYLGLRAAALAHWTTGSALSPPFRERLPGSFALIARYVWSALLPLQPQPLYALERPATLFEPLVLAGIGLVALGALLALAWRRRAPLVAFGVGWFFLSLLPILDLVPLASTDLPFAERHLFLASIGLAFAAAGALSPAPRRDAVHPDPRAGWNRPTSRRWLGMALCLALVTGWSAVVFATAPIYESDHRLAERMVQAAPRAALGHQNLGLALIHEGRMDPGLQALERAGALEPQNSRVQLALANGYVLAGRPVEGLRLLDQIAPHLGGQLAYIHLRAATHLMRQESEAAIRILAFGVQRYPDALALQVLLGRSWEQQGRFGRAEEVYRRALSRFPDSLEGHVGLAKLLLRDGRPAEAAPAARRAAQLHTQSGSAQRILALSLEAVGDTAGARQAWTRVLDLAETPAAEAEARQGLARIAETGDTSLKGRP